jgi:hypothetical protein
VLPLPVVLLMLSVVWASSVVLASLPVVIS